MSESTGDKMTPATPAVSAPAFKFEMGQRVVYRRYHPDDMRDVQVIGSHFNGNECLYSIATRISDKSIIAYDGIPESDLSELTPADRCRLGVESLGLGKAEPMEGGSGYRVRGSTEAAGSPGTLETPGD